MKTSPLPIDAQAASAPSNFLAAGTPVVTPEGLQAIERLQVGDRIMSWDEESDVPAVSRVMETFVGEARPVLDLHLGGVAVPLTVSEGVRLFAADGRWILSQDVLPGELLVAPDGHSVVVDGVARRASRAPVHNVEISRTHTYFAGANPVLVHNPTDDHYRRRYVCRHYLIKI